MWDSIIRLGRAAESPDRSCQGSTCSTGAALGPASVLTPIRRETSRPNGGPVSRGQRGPSTRAAGPVTRAAGPVNAGGQARRRARQRPAARGGSALTSTRILTCPGPRGERLQGVRHHLAQRHHRGERAARIDLAAGDQRDRAGQILVVPERADHRRARTRSPRLAASVPRSRAPRRAARSSTASRGVHGLADQRRGPGASKTMSGSVPGRSAGRFSRRTSVCCGRVGLGRARSPGRGRGARPRGL